MENIIIFVLGFIIGFLLVLNYSLNKEYKKASSIIIESDNKLRVSYRMLEDELKNSFINSQNDDMRRRLPLDQLKQLHFLEIKSAKQRDKKAKIKK